MEKKKRKGVVNFWPTHYKIENRIPYNINISWRVLINSPIVLQPNGPNETMYVYRAYHNLLHHCFMEIKEDLEIREDLVKQSQMGLNTLWRGCVAKHRSSYYPGRKPKPTLFPYVVSTNNFFSRNKSPRWFVIFVSCYSL